MTIHLDSPENLAAKIIDCECPTPEPIHCLLSVDGPKCKGGHKARHVANKITEDRARVINVIVESFREWLIDQIG